MDGERQAITWEAASALGWVLHECGEWQAITWEAASALGWVLHECGEYAARVVLESCEQRAAGGVITEAMVRAVCARMAEVAHGVLDARASE